MNAITSTPSSGIETVAGTPVGIPFSILSRLSYQAAIEYFALPIGEDEYGRLRVLMAYPNDNATLQALQVCVGGFVRPVAASRDEVLRLITLNYGHVENARHTDVQTPAGNGRLAFAANVSAISIVNDILHEAVRLKASDIHLEPFERELRVRFRIDGVLQEMAAVSVDRIAQVTSRIKVVSGMDIAERRRSQDGRMRLPVGNRDIDVRVSSLPTDFGEKMVLRVLDKNALSYSLEGLGMDARRLALFKRAIQMPNGIVLITGPTGSGKTTTLYSAINFLKRPDVNISTVEDPIEYHIPNVSQTQVKPEIGVTFSTALRTLLRQDPDIIMVGEMRDRETAEIAIRSSLTGHLVLSTLHTNDAASAITRLIDMGIEPYLVASSVSVIVAQRLVRRVCPRCRCEESGCESIKKDLGLRCETPVFKGLGCSECGNTGYKGRIGIYEVLPMTENVRRKIHAKSFSDEIRTEAQKEGLVSLRDNALSLLCDGVTSLEEVLREISVH